jgi:hypothetical protein
MNQRETNMKDRVFTMDKYYRFDRDIDYIPLGHFSIEDEIKDICKKNRIAIQSIKEQKIITITVIGHKTRSHKECAELQKALDEQI